MSAPQHPLPSGTIFQSLGGQFTYRVIGPCCQLFDREELPWPCCRIEWHGKEPSWRRVGRRFVPDLSSKNAPSYSVEILGQHESSSPFVLTLYWVKLSPSTKEWWYSRQIRSAEESHSSNGSAGEQHNESSEKPLPAKV